MILILKIKKKRRSDISVMEVDILLGASAVITSGQMAVVFYHARPVTAKTRRRTPWAEVSRPHSHAERRNEVERVRMCILRACVILDLNLEQCRGASREWRRRGLQIHDEREVAVSRES
ncbi:MAG: hypothetical protein GY859_31330 [Desulfobacterales bacterium]|nr:hypothetical protein [Desulfobacterales bacterium]